MGNQRLLLDTRKALILQLLQQIHPHCHKLRRSRHTIHQQSTRIVTPQHYKRMGQCSTMGCHTKMHGLHLPAPCWWSDRSNLQRPVQSVSGMMFHMLAGMAWSLRQWWPAHNIPNLTSLRRPNQCQNHLGKQSYICCHRLVVDQSNCNWPCLQHTPQALILQQLWQQIRPQCRKLRRSRRRIHQQSTRIVTPQHYKRMGQCSTMRCHTKMHGLHLPAPCRRSDRSNHRCPVQSVSGMWFHMLAGMAWSLR